MGFGDYYFAPGGGASAVWVADEAGPGDLIAGLGMLGGTNHRHLEVYYQLVDVSTPPEEPPEEPPVEPPIEPPIEPPEEPPAQPPESNWEALFARLDTIIDLLEKHISEG
jgi:hypothetical protein